jgi:hypothetical protein
MNKAIDLAVLQSPAACSTRRRAPRGASMQRRAPVRDSMSPARPRGLEPAPRSASAAARIGASARRRRGAVRRRPAELAGTLHAALGLSPVAHGRHHRAAPRQDRALPGVVAVLSAADIPGPNDCGAIVHDDPILADGEVRYVGQPVFAVIAETRDAARRAAAQAKQVLEIEPLPRSSRPRPRTAPASTCCRRCT